MVDVSKIVPGEPPFTTHDDEIRAPLEAEIERLEAELVAMTECAKNHDQARTKYLLELTELRKAPIDAIGNLLTQAMDQAVANGANSVSMPDEYVEIAVWLSTMTKHGEGND